MGIRVRLCSDWCLREADILSDYPQTSVSCIVRTQYPYFAQRYAGITGFGPLLVLTLNFYSTYAISFLRVLAAELTVSVICNMLLGTLWLSVLYGKGFLALLPMRVLKNLIMWPVNSMLFYTIGKTMEASGVFRLLKTGGRKALL